jgi:predicted metal-dependent enzyme (double-stranded beta helix superfamily)
MRRRQTDGPAPIFPLTIAMSTASLPIYGLADYVRDIEAVLERRPANKIIIREVSLATKRLCADDRWLDERRRVGNPDCYTRHLLHRDHRNRFVVLALVWMPGQMTPVHDHSCWGVMGLIQNSLEEVCFSRLDDGSRADFAELELSRVTDVGQGGVAYLLPPFEEIHRIGNTSSRPTISLHVYGRDLDEVNVFDQTSGKVSRMRIKYYSPECSNVPFVI